MTIYVNKRNGNEPITLEVPERFNTIVTEADREGEPSYEALADELRSLVENQIENPVEIYDDYDCAASWFSPILCW